ncbi:MAG: ABC transporter ATP-binding protein [Ignavibacteriales bacterium]|nr:ABC transporter ATP-binding protein [Ignavibacteriales bacterium]
MPIVHTEQLSKTYRSGLIKRREVAALKDVSISVERGEIFGLLGPNGAGKTTFVKILLSIVFPTKGDAEILDQKLGALGIREKSGYLPENHRYPNFLTGLQTLHLFGQLHGLNGGVLKDKSKSLLELVGLKDWGGVKIKRYSKGMLQRLGLAQALMNDPEILFLDEPTDGVDPVGRKEIRNLLKDLKGKGTTIFLNSHMLSEVEAISDRVAILNKGEVLKVGTVADITSTKLEYEIQLDQGASEQLCEKIRPLVRELKSVGKMLTITVYDKNDIHKVQDLIRQEGVFVESMTPRKSSLEDYFIQLIQSGDGK